MLREAFGKFKVNLRKYFFNRVCSILRDNLPVNFKEKSFYNSLDESSKKWLQTLLKNLNSGSSTNTPNSRAGSVPFICDNPYNLNGSQINSFNNFQSYDPYSLNNPYSVSNPYSVNENKK